MNSDRRSDVSDGRSGVAAHAAPALPAGAADGRARVGTGRSAAPWWSVLRSPWLLWSGGLLLVGIGLFSLYVRQSRIAPFNSDGASQVLQAQSMLHGNLLLSGWWTSDVSFYTTELPEYMLVEVFRGLRPDVVHICGALTYTLIVLLGALLARGRVKGGAGIARALLAGGIMLAPGIIGGTPVFLENPDHAGTAVPVLLTLLILDRAPERWWVPVAVGGLLAWTQVADQLSLVAATAPIAAVAVVRLLVLAIRRRPLAEYRYDALLLVAAGLSVGLAKLAEHAIRALGGFALHPLPQQLLAPSWMIRSNARVMGQTLLLLFGANNPGPPHHLGLIANFHLIGLALAVCGFAVALATFFTRRTDRVTQILVVATIATLAAGILGTELPALSHAHEVAILLPLGAVLAGRTLPGLVPARWRPARVVVPVLAVWLACGLAALCFAATWAPLPPPNQALATWLTDHDYTDGLGGYWQANSTTVTSGGKVVVAPVTVQATAVRPWNTWINWYEPNLRTADFVVAVSEANAVPAGLEPAAVRKHFGRPAHEYHVGPYLIMVYKYNLLTRLGGRVFPGNLKPTSDLPPAAAAAQAP